MSGAAIPRRASWPGPANARDERIPRRRRVTAAARALTVLAALAVLAACGDDGDTATRGSGRAAQRTPAGGGPTTVVRTLRRAPTFTLTDQEGEAFGTDDLLGRVWIATFMFTKCRGTCPTQTARMRELGEQFATATKSRDLHFVSISVDPETDRPARLKDYARAYEVDCDFWTFLTGERADIWLLSSTGFLLPTAEDPTNEDMPIAHSANFVLVDRRGNIRGYYDSQTAEGIAELVGALGPVLAEPAPERITFPPDMWETSWLEVRRKAQVQAAKAWTVVHDFAFTDRRRESGIRFVNRVVDDAGRAYKAVHYDHGNGLAVADVDGDGLLDLYFSNQVGSNQLWRNLGGGRFEDVTRRAGVAVKDAIGVTASFADLDNDGDPDLFVTTVRGGNHLFENDGTGRFRDITEAAGITGAAHSSAAVIFDYDRDGLLDIFVCNIGVYTKDEQQTVVDDSTTAGQEPGSFKYYVGLLDAFSGQIKPERTERSPLYRNLGGNRFRDVHEEVGLIDGSWTGDASPLDLNEDGWIDLYVLNMQGHDEYYENVEGRKFVRKSREIFPKTSWGAMGIKVFDFDLDGDMDIYITDMHSDMSKNVGPFEEKQKSDMQWPESILRSGGNSIWGNTFFENKGGGAFEEISDRIGAENYWPWGISVADLNADGYDDVFIASSMNHVFRYGINSVLLNDGGKRFLDAEFVLGVEPRRGPRFKPWFDLDCGSPDDSGHALCEGVSGPAVVWAPLGSRASAVFDLEGDGDLDIVTNDFNAEPMVLVSDLAERRKIHYLKVRLRGTKSNRDGLGAVVRVSSGGRVYTKVHDGQSGYLSQSAKPLYFGLGDARTVTKVEVRWPSGRTQTITADIPVDGQLEVVEP